MKNFSKSPLIYLALIATLLPAQTPSRGTVHAALLTADSSMARNQGAQARATELFQMGNQARAEHGLPALQWDAALYAAALSHAARMAQGGSIAHQYPGEAELSQRAGQAGAHFSYIEENIALGYSSPQIHQAWMNSRWHRENLLSPDVDRVGVAVVASGNALYAVADFGRAADVLSPEDVEARVAAMVQETGVDAHGNSPGARQACAQDHGLPVSLDNRRPEFIMRWQDSQLHRLPGALLDRIATGRYREAAVGSCPAEIAPSTFTTYKIAVLLLKPLPATPRTYLSQK